MQEIAQEVALSYYQNIWVDGSLKNGKWFAKVGQRRPPVCAPCPCPHPHLSLPEFQGPAPPLPDVPHLHLLHLCRGREGVFQQHQHRQLSPTLPDLIATHHIPTQVRFRIARRASVTGRTIPEKEIQKSLEAGDKSLKILTPHVDFVARINNDSSLPVLDVCFRCTPPPLPSQLLPSHSNPPSHQAFEMIDHSGSWDVLRSRFAQVGSTPGEFPSRSVSRCPLLFLSSFV